MASVTDSARATLRWIMVAIALFVWLLPDVALLVAYAILLADVLLPAVDRIAAVAGPRGRHLPHGVAAAIVVLALVVTVGGAVALSIPRLAAEAVHLAAGAPQVMTRVLQSLESFAAAHGLGAWLDPIVDSMRVNAAGIVRDLAGTLAGLAGKFFSGIGHVLGFALLPLLTFYLLADSNAVWSSALGFVPEEARDEVVRLGSVVGRALGSYVRGQGIVCVVTGIAVGIALAATHHPAALLLGIVAGAAELIPYVGFMVTAVTIVLAGLTASPVQALLGLGIYIALNWTIGVFVTPRVMGRFLRMHPFIVTVSVLAGAQLLGPAGALLALPGAAVLQAIMGEMAGPPKNPRTHPRAEARKES
jgi:predicted PurR-regulated permease PerM